MPFVIQRQNNEQIKGANVSSLDEIVDSCFSEAMDQVLIVISQGWRAWQQYLVEMEELSSVNKAKNAHCIFSFHYKMNE